MISNNSSSEIDHHQQESLTTTARMGIGVLYLVLGSTGIVSNGAVLLSIVLNKHLRGPFYVFVALGCLADLVCLMGASWYTGIVAFVGHNLNIWLQVY